MAFNFKRIKFPGLEKVSFISLPNDQKKFGVFGGVFTPNVLTILGIIMYLRLGWVVGNAGILGAIAIILIAKSISFCTALSMSSITTNIKIGAGGAYSIISRSLGLEAGGSIGIPFYISLMLSAALYIMGFTEGWLRIFPDHSPMLVTYSAWAVLLLISYISAHFAIRVQYIILVIVGISILSFIFINSLVAILFSSQTSFSSRNITSNFPIFSRNSFESGVS